MNWKQHILLVFICACFGFGLAMAIKWAWVAVDNYRKSDVVNYWVDPDTHCQYLIRPGVMVPRVSANGLPICRMVSNGTI